MKDWKFTDPQNVAVITTLSVVNEQKPILFVSHDNDDGGWQFQHDENPQSKNAMIVALCEIVKIDETIIELANLPLGWIAWREAVGEPWHRKKNQL